MTNKILISYNKYILIPVLSVILVVLAIDGFAAKKKASKRQFPHGCQQVGYTFKPNTLVLNSAGEEHPQILVLLHNTSKTKVKLRLKKPIGRGYAPHLKNEIKPNQWAALAMDNTHIEFHCKTAKSSVGCESALKICQYTRAKFPDSNYGSYWSVDSLPRSQTVRSAIQQGILLRW